MMNPEMEHTMEFHGPPALRAVLCTPNTCDLVLSVPAGRWNDCRCAFNASPWAGWRLEKMPDNIEQGCGWYPGMSAYVWHYADGSMEYVE